MHVPAETATKRPKSVRDHADLWYVADRDDLPDGVTYVNRLRAPRYGTLQSSMAYVVDCDIMIDLTLELCRC